MRYVPDASRPFETLESRLMLAAAPVAGALLSAGGVLSVRGERTAASEIVVKLSADGTQIETAVGANAQTFALADVKRVVVMGGREADTINVDLTGATFSRTTVISGGAGDDIITAGGEDDIIQGGLGDDQIEGGAGNDRIFGQAGDDLLNGGEGDDQVDGGMGDDVIDGGAGNDILRAGRGLDSVLGGLGDDTLIGDTDEGDVLEDTEGTNVITDLSEFQARKGGQHRPMPGRGPGGGSGGIGGAGSMVGRRR